MMQLTPFFDFGDDVVWSWKSNQSQGINKFQSVYRSSRPGWVAEIIAGTQGFNAQVDLFNQRRIAQGLPRVDVWIPDFTVGDLDGNPSQLELNAVRGYNGYCCNTGQFGAVWYEYALDTDTGDPLTGNITIVSDGSSYHAVWTQIPESQRPNSGDPYYVSRSCFIT